MELGGFSEVMLNFVPPLAGEAGKRPEGKKGLRAETTAAAVSFPWEWILVLLPKLPAFPPLSFSFPAPDH